MKHSVVNYCLFANIPMHTIIQQIFNSYFIANCPQYVTVNEFWKSVNTWQRYEKWQSGTFFGDTVWILHDLNVRSALFKVTRLNTNMKVKCVRLTTAW